jgi:putative transposase
MHVILRGIDPAATFFETENRTFFQETLDAVAVEESVWVHAYLLMTNHVHLLI